MICQNQLDENELRHNGLIVRPALSAAEMDRLRALFAAEPVSPNSLAYFATPLSTDYSYRKKIHDGITAIIGSHLQNLAPGYRISSAGFLARPGADRQGKVPLHRDFTFVDPAEDIALHAVVALQDSDSQSGSLSVIIGSHNWPHIAAVGFNPNPWDDHARRIETQLCRPLPLRAGEICLYDERLLVATTANMSGLDRLAAGASLLPKEKAARVYSYDQNRPNELLVFEASDEFFLRYNPVAPLTVPYLDCLNQIGRQEFHAVHMSSELVDSLCQLPPSAPAAKI